MKAKTLTARIQTFALKDLEDAPYNARVITQDAMTGLRESLAQFGLIEHPVVNVAGGKTRLVGGHQRVRVLRESGATNVDCLVVEFDSDTERTANLTLNNPELRGRFVARKTREVMAQLDALVKDRSSLKRLRIDALPQIAARDAKRDIEEQAPKNARRGGKKKTPEATTPSVSKTGQESKKNKMYMLGEHRIWCGSLFTTTTLKTFGVEHADMGLSWLSLNGPFNLEWLDVYVGQLLRNTAGSIYITTTANNMAEVQGNFVARGGRWENTLLAYCGGDGGVEGVLYRDIVLPIIYGSKDGIPALYYSDKPQSNVWTLKTSPPRNEIPVEVAETAITNATCKGDIVLDVNICGGSVLVAAEKLERKVIGFVSSPRDCDRARKRWTEAVFGDGADWRAHTQEVTA